MWIMVNLWIGALNPAIYYATLWRAVRVLGMAVQVLFQLFLDLALRHTHDGFDILRNWRRGQVVF